MIEVQTMPINTTNINEMPLSVMTSWWLKFGIFIDRYYFPIMNFGVVKVPQLFIMMIAIRIALMFHTNARLLSKTLVSGVSARKNLTLHGVGLGTTKIIFEEGTQKSLELRVLKFSVRKGSGPRFFS